MTDLFLKTYPKDYGWLNWNFQSLIKYVKGYDRLIIVIPEGTRNQFNETVKQLPERTEIIEVKEEGNGYIFQQYIKMSAFEYSNADHIVFFDSDNVWQQSVDFSTIPEKPLILMTKYEQVGDAICWKRCVDTIFDKDVKFEFMRRLPFVYHRSTLVNLAQWINKPLKQFVMSHNEFSEFNVIGAFAYYFEFDQYTFIDTDNWTYVEPLLRQFWSLEGWEKNKAEIVNILNK